MAAKPRVNDDRETVYPRSRAAWRAWLRKHHATSPPVWLVYDKKRGGGRRNLAYGDAVEEALCFGWIDSLMRPHDEGRYKQLFSPRRARSGWSKINKERVARMTEAGLMTPAGLAKVESAQRDGSWTKLDAMEALRVPDDLKRAWARIPKARRHFLAFAPSYRKGALWWIASAKRPETRAKRIAEIVRRAALNQKMR
jgi:uncharacterized protein YdeI (YjbR/CyaY-like superfamily)